MPATFDIDWHPINPDLKDKVLLPVLGEQYGKTLETGQLKLHYEGGTFRIEYHDNRFPIAPSSYIPVLSSQLHDLTRKLGDENEHLLEYRSIITAIGHLPPTDGRAAGAPGGTLSGSRDHQAAAGRARGSLSRGSARHRARPSRFTTARSASRKASTRWTG